MGEEAHGDLTATELAGSTRADRIGLGIGLVVGIPIMLVGIIGILRHPESTPIPNYLRFFLGADILHDFVVAPIAVVISFLLLRRVPSIARGPLRAALFGSAVVIAIAWPGIRRYGHHQAPDNRSVQPLNYATSTLTVVVVVVVIAAIWLAIALVRARRSPDPSSASGPGSIPSDPE